MTSAYELYKEGSLLNNRYLKEEDISEGSYGLVSLARDTKRSRLVAVKYIFNLDDEMPSRVKSQDDKYSQSIKRMNNNICEEALHEIKIHEKLGNHEYIVSFLDCFDSFIILEYCPRGDLYDAIKNGTGPTSTRDIINVTNQLISAVEFAHSKSIYHRDIKPENILIASDWTIRLSDWGLATTSRFCNDTGIGSERYMAPELFDEDNDRYYDASKVDIWSIGICLLNLVFCKSPFTAANCSDKSFSYFACNREALFDIFSTMSMDLFAALRYSLTIDPGNRDLSQMKEELLAVRSLTVDDDLKLMEESEKSQYLEVKPITIQNKAKPHGRKSFVIQTPNSHINSHFHDFKRDQYNRKDYFTPPAVSAHYMDRFEKSRKGIYQPPHQRPSTPKSSGNSGSHLTASYNNNSSKNNFWIPSYFCENKKKRRGSFGSFSGNSGKYIPPNLRSPAYKSPFQNNNKHNEAVVSDDDDDGLFVLDEADSSAQTPRTSLGTEDNLSTSNEDSESLDLLQNRVSTMNLEDNYSSDSSSAPSLVQTSLLTPHHKSTSSTLHDRNTKNKGESDLNYPSFSSGSEGNSGTKSEGVYIPPHHRSHHRSHFKPLTTWNNNCFNQNQNSYSSQNQNSYSSQNQNSYFNQNPNNYFNQNQNSYFNQNQNSYSNQNHNYYSNQNQNYYSNQSQNYYSNQSQHNHYQSTTNHNYHPHHHYNHHNNRQHKHRRHSHSCSSKKDIYSSSVPYNKTNGFSRFRSEIIDDDDEEYDFEKSDLYKKFAFRVGAFGDSKMKNKHMNSDGFYKNGFKGKQPISEPIRELSPTAIE